MTVSVALFTFAAVLNIVAAAINIWTIRRARRRIEENRETFMRLIAFAAFMSRPESGAPEHVRDLARQALPEGARVSLARLGMISPTLH